MRASNKLLATAMIEVDDICEFDPLPQTVAAKVPQPAQDDTVEIELTAEQMDALLSGFPLARR